MRSADRKPDSFGDYPLTEVERPSTAHFPPHGGPRRFQFSLFNLMLLMLVVTAVGVVGGRLRPALEVDKASRVTFVFFTLLGPMFLLVVLATLHHVWRWRKSPPTKRLSGTVVVSDNERLR